MLKYIVNEQHYTLLTEMLDQVKETLWIGTADLKDLYIKKSGQVVPLLALLEDKIKKGVSIHLVHAKEPGQNFLKDFDRFPLLWCRMERVLCPGVHFKLMLFDLKTVYLGSANLTGAAFGMKSIANRNFEAGIYMDIPALVETAMIQFDELWMDIHVKCAEEKILFG